MAKLPSSAETEKINTFLGDLQNDASKQTEKLDIDKVKQKVKQSYIDLGLMEMDQSGQCQWTQEIFEKISNNLSDDISQATIKEEIDKVFENIKANPYLMRAILDIINNAGETNEDMLKKGKAEIIHELESVLPFALALNLLTKAQIQHSDVLGTCVELWKRKRSAMGSAIRGLGLTKTIKLISVEMPIVKMLRGRTQHNYPHSLGRCILPFNIIEATALETVSGSHENACAGLTLAQQYPGKYTQHASELDEQGLEPLFNYPMPKQWSDLYTTWNMQFCATSNNRPELLSKLLIPAVSGYQDNPRAYISRRAYALYSTLNYLFFRTGQSDPVPSLPKGTEQAWGQSNRVCSRLYQREIEKSSPKAAWSMTQPVNQGLPAL